MTSPPIRLLFLSGASGYEHSGSVWLTDDQVRMWSGLADAFDATLLGLHVGRDERRSARLSKAFDVEWISARFRARWPRRLLPPVADLARMWKRLRASDAFLTFMPEISGIAPLVLALLARRPRYVLQISAASHFRSWSADGPALRFFSRLAMNVLGAMSTGIFVVDDHLKQEYIAPLRRRCVSLMFTTLTQDDFQDPVPLDPEEVRLLVVARLVQNKRIDVAIRATRALLDRGMNVRLTLLGEGPLEESLLALANELDLGDHFEFPGQIDDPEKMRAHYKNASILVLSSETEGLSLAVLEAMAASTPVVTTAAGGLRRFCRHGHDSIVVPSHDPAAFADAIEGLVADPNRYLAIARAAQDKVRTLLNTRWVEDIANVIRKDLARPG